MNFIDEKTATECLHILKENDIGVETFMILNTLKSQLNDGMKYIERETNKKTSKNDSNQPSFIYNLLSPSSSEFSSAFYYAVRNTLVCKNLEEATKVAFSEENKKFLYLLFFEEYDVVEVKMII
jgi:structural maintenance of chromosome 4